ncbi:MAG: DNA/RNA non-specific endonuclease [Bacteroidetes bacterium]|nr:DNA/RNA non-specific endonuclease [Bacteroidota bacterium]
MSDIKKIAFDKDELKKANGYQASWASKSAANKITLDTILNSKLKQALPKVEGNSAGVLKYSYLSVLYNTKRKMPFVSAYNIEGDNRNAKRGTFRPDPRVNDKDQLNKKFYDLIAGSEKDFEIGHMAAHDEMAWGDKAQLQSYRTFFYTNSCPQVKRLNAGLWRGLEQYFISEAEQVTNKKAHIFTGPVLANNDPEYVKDASFQLAKYFFKVVVFEFEKKLRSTAFVMSQLKRLRELKLIVEPTVEKFRALEAEIPFMDFAHNDVFQVDVDLVEKVSGLNFTWSGVKKIKVENGMKKLDAVEKVGGTSDLKDIQGVSESLNTKAASSRWEVKNFTWK